MPSGRNLAFTGSPLAVQTPQPIVCIVTADNEFRSLLTTELLPWFKVVARENYEDLARWTRESRVSAVVLDIDTEGEEPGIGNEREPQARVASDVEGEARNRRRSRRGGRRHRYRREGSGSGQPV